MSAVHEIFRPMLETFGDPAQDRRKTLRGDLIADVRDGARIDDIYIESTECAEWIRQESFNGLGYDAIDALGDKYGEDKRWAAKFDALWIALMDGSMTVDQLAELRDMQREALSDYCTDWARRVVRDELS